MASRDKNGGYRVGTVQLRQCTLSIRVDKRPMRGRLVIDNAPREKGFGPARLAVYEAFGSNGVYKSMVTSMVTQTGATKTAMVVSRSQTLHLYSW